MCKQSQTFSVRKNKAIKSLGGVVLAVAAIVAIGGSASADEVTATNATSSNAPTTAVTTATDTTSNATTALATTNANTPATPTTTQETPKEIPAKVESVTQAEAVKTVDNAQATLKADATEAEKKGVTVEEAKDKTEVTITDETATDETNKILTDLTEQDKTIKTAEKAVESVDTKAKELTTSTKAVDQVEADAKKAGVTVNVKTSDGTPKYQTNAKTAEELQKQLNDNAKKYGTAVDSAVAKQSSTATTSKTELDNYIKSYTDFKNGVVSSTGLTWSNGVQLEAGQGAEFKSGDEQVIDWADGKLKTAAKYATQGTYLNQNSDANFDSIFKINGTGTVKVKNTTKGDVDLTFSDIKSSGATSNYVAIYGAPNGGIAWSVFGLVNGANTGGGVGEGASGAGSAGNIVLTNIYSYKLALETSEGVKVVTFNDLDNDQTLSDLSGFDGTAVETGANVTTGSGTYGAGAGDVTQAAGSKLDSNSIRWVYGDSKARKASFTHATSGNNTSIVGGIFGEDSNIPVEPTKPVLTLEKVTVGKPKVAVTVHYYEVKETPKPEAPAKPATPTETPKTPVTYTPSETPKAPVTYQAPALPQTGEVETGLAVTAGIATLFSAVALAGVKRKA